LRCNARCLIVASALAVVLAGAGCRQDMQDQPKFIPLRASESFADHRSGRPIVEGTVARGRLQEDELLDTGKVNGQLADTFPFPITAEVLGRGRERFDIFCAPCHDRTGSGDGMIVRRGYKRPPSFHLDRLRDMPAGYFFDVITNGFGAMPDYRSQITERDRWAIVSYLRALQLSQHATIEDVPPSERPKLEGGSR
jgi:mono/diheme cytochrome c family protein